MTPAPHTPPSTLARTAAAVGVGLATLAPAPEGARAAEAASATPTVVIVRVAKPWYAPRSAVVSKMRDAVPEYARLPGLRFKAFSMERDSGDFGGLYLWASRDAAREWFNPAWFERVKRERGTDASVRMFDAPVTIDNVPGGTPASIDSTAVGTLVEVPVPPGVTREALEQGFRDAMPVYQQVPGLLRKAFIVSDRGTFGGVYLWRDEAAARAWFTPAWTERVVKAYGAPPRLEWFDTPILTPGP